MKGIRSFGIWGGVVLSVFSLFNPLNAQAVSAAPVKLAWDASTCEDVAGYSVYYVQVGSTTTNSINVGTNLEAVIPDLAAQASYVFHVVAYGTNQVQSVPSNQIQYSPPVLTPLQLAAQEDGTMHVQFRGPAGDTCLVEYTDTLDTPNWQTLGSAVAAADGTIVMNDPAVSETGMRFYRAFHP